MANFEIKINDNIEVLYNKEIYKSKIQDVEDDSISIYLPGSEGKYLPLEIGEETHRVYYGERDRVYSFKCKVIKRSADGAVRLLTLGKTYDIERIQRRNFVRVSYLESVQYRINEDSSSITFKNATMIDLSGGGLKFRTADKIEKEELITLRLKYHDNEIFIKSKVVRRNTNDNGDYTYGLEFIDISEMDREKIIQLVFQIMRKQNEVI